MRIYTIDQLTPEEIDTVNDHLHTHYGTTGLEGAYRLPVPVHLLSTEQQRHMTDCGPYFLALETTGSALHLELLVRAENRITCDCLSYAPPELREYMIHFLDSMMHSLGISC